MRFKMIVAVLGLILRCAVDRVVRPLTTFAICSNVFFELFDSSRRLRKSITWAFSSFICIEQLRIFCACRFWIPITLFNCSKGTENEWKLITFKFFQHFFPSAKAIDIKCIRKKLPFALLSWISVPCECSCFGKDQLDVEQSVFVVATMQSSVAIASTMPAMTNSMCPTMCLVYLVKIHSEDYSLLFQSFLLLLQICNFLKNLQCEKREKKTFQRLLTLELNRRTA